MDTGELEMSNLTDRERMEFRNSALQHAIDTVAPCEADKILKCAKKYYEFTCGEDDDEGPE